ncbi:response regulator [Sulfitobacter sp. M57]|uniref:ATP-binding protein n=1 Tax=unclassified Sulfitobacter TaxID=196795 RepID=UPI0023E0F2BF|nr:MULTISPECIES: ATP-binding protein [unclassified Sulfitobacter]MDF3414596.1 response regulator [Sulfitobacter sp. KE5]MDF3422078.1 response regulator [Sulfitobacter sp. KE43]MDF3433143.1 response regulator [Sulfitobacter sp. KE42]MDF3458783.1 response regulator [Sulfitobacter sp. S74]MDF3462682.1 response regulator [Sulfitobacter sp. Ks18]
MRRTNFDTRLIQILSTMAALAIMVGIAAIGVNQYLVRTQDALIQTNMPAITLASKIGASAEVMSSLASAFAQADTREDLEQVAAVLGRTVMSIEDGTRTLEEMGPPATGAAPYLQAREIVGRMTTNALENLTLEESIRAEVHNLTRDGARLDALIEAETDLARLRITAGIADLYLSPDADPRSALDALADRHFFAFERLTELARLIDAVRLQFQQVPTIASLQEVEIARSELSKRLSLALRRVAFLPSPLAAKEATSLLNHQQRALDAGGLINLQRDRIALQASITQDRVLLQGVIAALSERARHARDVVRAEGLAQIAAAKQKSTFLLFALLVVVASAVVIGAVLWLYARRQLVARLGNISRRIVAVARGEYGTPILISGHDEIGRMEKALNILRRRARDATRLRDSLEDAVIARTGDVVREMHTSDTARAEAESANRSKTEFLARMSHEIRTPLNGIIGMLDLLEVDEPDPDRKRRTLTALNSAHELLDITNDILNFASAENRSNRSNPVHFRLRELVGQMGFHLQSLATPKGLEAIIDLSEPAPLALLGDVVKIRQIVGNLISNAVKYTERGTVTLTVDHAIDGQTGHHVVSFTVADTGIGMTSEAIPHAFDAYMRADSAKRAGIEGIGLGLAISRTLTDALNGALSVESKAGVGSRFTLTVPLKRGDPKLAAESEARAPNANRGSEVLVIDDHAVNLMVARGYLERLGCLVSEAATGASGLKVNAERRFDLVLIDLDLPDMRGEEVAKQMAKNKDAPLLVALTAHSIEDTPENRAKLEVARILSKPISPRALAEVLDASTSVERDPDHNVVLKSLREDISDLGPQTTELIVREFLDDLPHAVESIQLASAEAQRKAAHKLKGAAANFRLERLCAVLARIEAAEDGVDEGLLDQLLELAQDATIILEKAVLSAMSQAAVGSTK